jgi:hypothetical protein
MWVLVMFLLILSQAGSRQRMFIYAGLFILAEAVMYYLILNVWYTVFDFVGLNKIVRPLIGLLALGSGAYFLNKYVYFSPVCDVSNQGQKQKLTTKIQELATKPMSIAVIFGILAVAFAVNIFEFACSIGIPQTFTKILEQGELNVLQVQGYMGLYILMYVIDDLIVFALALWGLNKVAQSQKFTKWSLLIGGVFMILLGIIMLVKPEILVF